MVHNPAIPRHRRRLHLEAYEDGDERLALLGRSEKMIPKDLLRMLLVLIPHVIRRYEGEN